MQPPICNRLLTTGSSLVGDCRHPLLGHAAAKCILQQQLDLTSKLTGTVMSWALLTHSCQRPSCQRTLPPAFLAFSGGLAPILAAPSASQPSASNKATSAVSQLPAGRFLQAHRPWRLRQSVMRSLLSCSLCGSLVAFRDRPTFCTLHCPWTPMGLSCSGNKTCRVLLSQVSVRAWVSAVTCPELALNLG